MSTNEPTVTVEATIIEMVRAMAAMGHALAARVESHRSAAAANRLGEHKVLLEQGLEDAYRQKAELQRENAEIRQAHASTKIALDDALADAEALRAQLEDLRQIEKQRVFFYEHAKQRMHEIEESLGAVARERDEAKRERDEAIARLENDRAGVELTLELGKKNRDEAEAKLVQMERARDAARWDRDKAYDELASVKRERDAAVAESHKMKASLSASAADYRTMKFERDMMRYERDQFALRARAAKELGQVTEVDIEREMARLVCDGTFVPAPRPPCPE